MTDPRRSGPLEVTRPPIYSIVIGIVEGNVRGEGRGKRGGGGGGGGSIMCSGCIGLPTRSRPDRYGSMSTRASYVVGSGGDGGRRSGLSIPSPHLPRSSAALRQWWGEWWWL